MKRAAALAAALLVVLPAFAAPKKHKDWGASPEAYFLTADERKKWDAVTTDEEAEAFIKTYRDARGKGFQAAIQSRIDFADRTLGIGKKKGSETLRGKTLILLGSPTTVDATTIGPGTRVDVALLDARTTGGGGSKDPGSSNPNPFSNSGGPGDTLRNSGGSRDGKLVQKWTYAPGAIPVGEKSKDTRLGFTIDADGKEEVVEPEKLEQLFASVIAYWGPKPPARGAPARSRLARMGVKISGTLTGLATELVHEDSGTVIRTVPPVDNGGDGSSFSPTDLAATSLGACASTTIALYAKRNGIPLEKITFELEKLMNAAPRRLGKLVVTYKIATSGTDEDFAKLVHIGKTCPVRLSLGPDVEVEERYERES